MAFTKMTLNLINNAAKERTVTIRECGPDDLENILDLQTFVRDLMEDETLFAETSRKEFADSLLFDYCIGAFEGQRLMGVSLLLRNSLSARNLGNHLGYDTDELLKAVTFDTTFIHPDLRGYSLQKLFIDIRKKKALEWGAKEALVSVSGDNIHSMQNLASEGFSIVKVTYLYGGLRRYIMRTPLA